MTSLVAAPLEHVTVPGSSVDVDDTLVDYPGERVSTIRWTAGGGEDGVHAEPYAEGAGVATVTLSTTGTGRKAAAGVGAAEVDVDGTGAGRKDVGGTGSTNVDFTSTYEAEAYHPGVVGSGSTSVSWSATGSGSKSAAGSGSEDLIIDLTAGEGRKDAFGGGDTDVTFTTSPGVDLGGSGVAEVTFTTSGAGITGRRDIGVTTVELTTSGAGVGNHRSARRLEAIVPAYFTPWTSLVAEPDAVRYVVADPGETFDSGYASTQIPLAHAAGLLVLGRIPLDGGERAIGDVVAQMADFVAWYGVDGFFLDDAPIGADTSYLATARAAAGARTIVANFGMVPDEAVMAVVDVAGVTEVAGRAAYQAATFPSWVDTYERWRFVHLIYDVPAADFDLVYQLARTRHAATVMITDRAGAGRWSELPTYWALEQGLLQGSTATAFVSTSGLGVKVENEVMEGDGSTTVTTSTIGYGQSGRSGGGSAAVTMSTSGAGVAARRGAGVTAVAVLAEGTGDRLYAGVRVWDGAALVERPVYVWTGTALRRSEPFVWDGASWVLANSPG